jgi:hypothetical protein
MSLMQSGRLPCPREPPLELSSYLGVRVKMTYIKVAQDEHEQGPEYPLCSTRALVILLVSVTVGLLAATAVAVESWAKLSMVIGGLGALLPATCACIAAWLLVSLSVARTLNRLVI